MGKIIKFIENQAKVREEIKMSYGKKRLIPFIGAGFSRNIERYPDWPDVLDKLSMFLSREIGESISLKEKFEDPNEAIEYFVWQTGKRVGQTRIEIFDYGKKYLQKQLNPIFEELRPIKVEPTDFNWRQHTLLALKFKKIFTTNWDLAIETACCNNYHIIYPIEGNIKIVDEYGNENKALDFSQDKHYIIKYHGHFDEEYEGKSLVACETDYYNRIRRMFSSDSLIDGLFMDILENNDVLFLGYSFADKNIKYLLNQLQMIKAIFYNRMKEPPKFYWVLPDYSEIKIQYRIEFLENWKWISPYFLLKPEESLLKDPIDKSKLIKECLIKLLEDL